MSVFLILLCPLLKFSKHDLLLSLALSPVSLPACSWHCSGQSGSEMQLRGSGGAACFCIPPLLHFCVLASLHPMLRNRGSVLPLPAVTGCAGSAVEPHKQPSSSVINIQQTEQVLGRPGCSEGAHESGGSSVCFSFHLSALIFRALQFGQTNISRVHGESMQCSVQDIIHLSPLSATSLQTDINKSFIVLHHHNALKLRKEEKK